MISTKWFQGKISLNDILKIREQVFCEEKSNKDFLFTDNYDDFALNVLILEDEVSVGCGRLLFKEGKYFIDNVGVLKEYRGRNYGDLILRMLVRRAVNMGAETTWSLVDGNCKHLFERVGFIVKEESEQGKLLMAKTGDVGGECS